MTCTAPRLSPAQVPQQLQVPAAEQERRRHGGRGLRHGARQRVLDPPPPHHPAEPRVRGAAGRWLGVWLGVELQLGAGPGGGGLQLPTRALPALPPLPRPRPGLRALRHGSHVAPRGLASVLLMHEQRSVSRNENAVCTR